MANPDPPSMRPTAGKKYWAFISYSSKDKKWGQWLHRRLESYPIPKEFHGTELFDGSVLGKNLRPIFRDRDELAGSAELGPAILEALRQTRFLIVLCSRNAAKSQWVNKEIEDFKNLGGEQRILALILDGEPNATNQEGVADAEECFPPALRYPCEPLAGDLRKEGDGKERGFLKVIAGISQLDFDALYRRHERAQKKRRTVMATVALAVIVSLAGLTGFALQQRADAKAKEKLANERKEEAEHQRNLADENRREAEAQQAIARENATQARLQEQEAVRNLAQQWFSKAGDWLKQGHDSDALVCFAKSVETQPTDNPAATALGIMLMHGDWLLLKHAYAGRDFATAGRDFVAHIPVAIDPLNRFFDIQTYEDGRLIYSLTPPFQQKPGSITDGSTSTVLVSQGDIDAFNTGFGEFEANNTDFSMLSADGAYTCLIGTWELELYEAAYDLRPFSEQLLDEESEYELGPFQRTSSAITRPFPISTFSITGDGGTLVSVEFQSYPTGNRGSTEMASLHPRLWDARRGHATYPKDQPVPSGAEIKLPKSGPGYPFSDHWMDDNGFRILKREESGKFGIPAGLNTDQCMILQLPGIDRVILAHRQPIPESFEEKEELGLSGHRVRGLDFVVDWLSIRSLSTGETLSTFCGPGFKESTEQSRRALFWYLRIARESGKAFAGVYDSSTQEYQIAQEEPISRSLCQVWDLDLERRTIDRKLDLHLPLYTSVGHAFTQGKMLCLETLESDELDVTVFHLYDMNEFTLVASELDSDGVIPDPRGVMVDGKWFAWKNANRSVEVIDVGTGGDLFHFETSPTSNASIGVMLDTIRHLEASDPPAWLQDVAIAIAGYDFDGYGKRRWLPDHPEALKKAAERAGSEPSRNPHALIGKWALEDRESRPQTPWPFEWESLAGDVPPTPPQEFKHSGELLWSSNAAVVLTFGNPDLAGIEDDYVFMGSKSGRAQLPAGQYTVTARSEDGFETSRRIRLEVNGQETIDLGFKHGGLRVHGRPEGLKVYLDDDLVGVTQDNNVHCKFESERISPGIFKLAVVDENGMRVEENIEIEPGRMYTYSYRPSAESRPAARNEEEEVAPIVYDEMKQIILPNGFQIIDGKTGDLVETKRGEARVDAKVEFMINARKAYVSGWSWDRRSDGLSWNYMLPLD